MAANYWVSTQRQNWLFEPYEITDLREDLEKQHAKVIEQYPLPDRRLMFVFIKDKIMHLGKRLPSRQQCIATALVYLHRYFLFNTMQNVNLYLLTATAFYLASKTEESPHHIRLVAQEARTLWPEYIPSDPSRIGEIEFCLISEMHSQLIIWHPYRSLTALKENQKLSLTIEEISLAWSIVNDTFMTDLPLTCPPYLIAITAMFLAVIFVPQKNPDLKPNHQDLQSMLESQRFGGMGGRAGFANSMAHAVNGSNISQPSNGLSRFSSMSNSTHTPKPKSSEQVTVSDKLQVIIEFLVESDIDIKHMMNATQEIISLYEVWEQYNEKNIKDAVTRCLRNQHLDT